MRLLHTLLVLPAVALVMGTLLARASQHDLILHTVTLAGIPSAVALDAPAGRLFVASATGGTISTFDTRSGQLLRTVAVGANPMALAVDAKAGRVYATGSGGSGGGAVLMLDALTGQLLRRLPATEPQALAVDERHGLVLVTTTVPSAVLELDAVTGRTVRVIGVPCCPTALATDAANGRAMVVSRLALGTAGTVSILDIGGGRILHFSGLNTVSDQVVVDPVHGHVFTDDATASGNSISMLDARSGALLRATTVKGGLLVMALAGATGRLFVANALDGSVHLLDAASGRLLGTVGVGRSPLLVETDDRASRVLVVNQDASGDPRVPGSVSVLDARNGGLLRTVTLKGNPVAAALDQQSGTLLVAGQGGLDSGGFFTGNGALNLLNARTATPVRIEPVGFNPLAVVVDPGSGHAFLVDGGGQARVIDRWGWAPGWLRGRLPFLPARRSTAFANGSVTMVDLRG